MKTYAIIFIAGLLFGGVFLYLLFWPSSEQITTYKTEIEYIEKDTTIYSYKDSLIYNIIEVLESPEPAKYDSIRRYAGTVPIDYGTLDWKLTTLGSLESFEFNPKYSIPVTTTTIKTQAKPKRLYGYVQSDFAESNLVGLDYINGRIIIGASYNINAKRTSAKIGLLIFGK